MLTKPEEKHFLNRHIHTFQQPRFFLSFLLLLLSGVTTAIAGEADVINVKATQHQDKSWRFDVTVSHKDEGWDHYVTEWLIVTEDRKILARRTIYHPHVREMPFTRNLQWVKIPPQIKKVTIVARDSVHGIMGKSITVDLAKATQTAPIATHTLPPISKQTEKITSEPES